MSEQKPPQLCPVCNLEIQVTDVDIELQSRKHNRTMFGTVPQLTSTLRTRAIADKLEAAPIIHRLEKERDALKAENKELRWFAEQVNKYVMPGETDTQDAALKIVKERDELKAENRQLKIDIDEGSGYCEDLDMQNNKLRAEVNELKFELDKQMSDDEFLKQFVKKYAPFGKAIKENEKLKAEVERLKSMPDWDLLFAESDGLRNIISGLRAEIEELKRVFDIAHKGAQDSDNEVQLLRAELMSAKSSIEKANAMMPGQSEEPTWPTKTLNEALTRIDAFLSKDQK